MRISKEFLFAFLIISCLFAAVYKDIFPFKKIMDWGARSKALKENLDIEQTYQIIDVENSSDQFEIILDLKKGPHYWNPQIAIWLEDSTGCHIQTLFVTNSTALGLFYSGRTADNYKQFDLDKGQLNPNEKARMVNALPFWLQKRKNHLPASLKDMGLKHAVDGYSGATPKGSFYLKAGTNGNLKRLCLMLEINVAFDENEYYSEYDFPDDTIYHGGNGLLGQPSMIYRADIDLSNINKFYFMKLMGHAHHSGMTDSLYTDLSKITTAKLIVDRIVVSIKQKE